MSRAPIFLTAEWRHLLLLNYTVDPALLAAHLPPGLELDLWNGQMFVSVVGFLFQNTRLRGVPIPFHGCFPEVNLRFYVKRTDERGTRRGVMFWKELAPRRAVAWIARRVYGENYLALPMRAEIEFEGSNPQLAHAIAYRWRFHREAGSIAARCDGKYNLPEPGSLDEFIIEHYWGYSNGLGRGVIEYQVEHPPWRICPVTDARFHGDVARLYGPPFAGPLATKPASAFIADGSRVAVRKGQILLDDRSACITLRRSAASTPRSALAGKNEGAGAAYASQELNK